MHLEIISYLNNERVGVIALEMADGSPHGATVHFAYSENPFEFYFQTYRDSRKAELLVQKGMCRATFVLGTSEETMKTFQLDGEVHLIKPEEKDHCEKIYLGKFPEKTERSKDPRAIYFKFVPTWWRYSDFMHKEGKLILTS